MKKTLLVTAVAIAVLACASTASATSLAGDTIHGYYEFPTQSSIYLDLGTFAAPGGGNIFGLVDYTVTGNQVIATSTVASGPGPYWIAAAFNGFTFVDTTKNPHIIGITLDPSTTASGASVSDASFTSNSVSFNFQGQTWASGQSAVFDLTFGGVPEPATWAMMLVGLGGLGVAMRSRRRWVAATV